MVLRVAEYVKRYASSAIVLDEEGEEQHGKKPRAALSSSLSSSASTDNESPSPSTSPMMHPMAGTNLSWDGQDTDIIGLLNISAILHGCVQRWPA